MVAAPGDSAVRRMTLGTTGEPTPIAATTDIGYRDFLGLDKPPTTVVIRPEEGAPGEGSPLTVEFGVIPISAAR